jgi:hypothetical protein
MIRHERSLSPELMALLRRLMELSELEEFSLGGGTSLAITFGHRESIDIDLFSDKEFHTEICLAAVRRICPETEVVNRTQGSLCLIIRQIKVDILHHPYPLLEPPVDADGIRLVSLPDIAAMKVNAVTNRGSKRDFSDLLLLHERGISLSQSLDCFCAKYGAAGRFLAIRSLTYFEDAELEPDPVYLNGWTWKEVRNTLERLARALAI